MKWTSLLAVGMAVACVASALLEGRGSLAFGLAAITLAVLSLHERG